MPKAVAKTVLLTAGMHDNHGRELVVASLASVKGVKQVDVNLFRATAVVVHTRECQISELMRVIEDAGFHAVVQRNKAR